MKRILPKRLPLLLLLWIFSCPPPLSAQEFLINDGDIESCVGTFLDSGGSSGNYGLNEDFTVTICPEDPFFFNNSIELAFSGIDIGPGDVFFVYDGSTVDPATQVDGAFLSTPNQPFVITATAANDSGCLTVSFQSDAIDDGTTGWTATISCVASCQPIEAVLVSSDPVVSPPDTGYIDVCPGQLITLEATGIYPQNGTSYTQSDELSQFEWIMGDGTTQRGSTIEYAYDNPGGYSIQLTITDTLGCRNSNYLARRVRVSPAPRFELNENIDPSICANQELKITSSVDPAAPANLTAIAGTGNFGPPPAVTDTVFLPDGIGVSYSSTLLLNQFQDGAALENAADFEAVNINIEHSFIRDLLVEIICPNGQSAMLFNGRGFPAVGSANLGEPFADGAVDSSTNTLDDTPGIPYVYTFTEDTPTNGTFRDFNPGTPQVYTTVPSNYDPFETYEITDTHFPAGSYLPEQSFANLVGCPLNGAWSIRVTDEVAKDNGWIMGWGIEMSEDLFATTETFTPAFIDWGWENCPTITTANQECLVATPPNAGVGEYTFWTENEFGCVFDTTLLVNILPENHPDCDGCEDSIVVTPDTAICPGDTIQLNGQSTAPEAFTVLFERFPKYELGAANHPTEASAFGSTLPINSVKPDTLTNFVTQLESICIDMTTDDLSDLEFRLQAPDGTVVRLINRGDMSGNNMISTCFTPLGLDGTVAGAAETYTGNFQSVESLATFHGTSINGDWTLLASDNAGTDFTGELLHWSISFNAENEFSYQWSPVATLSDVTIQDPLAYPVMATDYILSVTDCYGCIATDTVSVSMLNDLPAVMLACQEIGSTILFTWDALTGFTDYEYRVTDATNGSTLVDWTTTTDTQVSVENLNNGDMVTIEVRLIPIDMSCEIPSSSLTCTSSFCGLNITPPMIVGASCFNTNDGQFSTTALAGSAPFQLTLTPESAPPITYPLDTLVVNDLLPGNYQYTVTDNSNCLIQGEFSIAAPDSISTTLAQTNIGCAGTNEGQIAVSAVGGTGTLTYTWDPIIEHAEVISDLAPGTYSLTVTDTQGCNDTTSINVQEAAPISFNFIIAPPACNGGNDGQLGVNQFSGGLVNDPDEYQILWYDGSTETTVQNVAAGEYSVTISDSAGCSASQTRELPDPDDGIDYILDLQPPSCAGETDGAITVSITNSPNGLPIDYDWAAPVGSTDSIANGLTAGTYQLILTDPEGCRVDTIVSLFDPPVLNFSSTTTPADCFGAPTGAAELSASGGIPPYRFIWPDGIQTTSRTNILAGDYMIQLVDDNNCQIINTITVGQPATITASVDTDPVDCFEEQNGGLAVNVSGGSPPFRYSLDGDNYTTNSQFLGLPAGEYDIYIEDNNDCIFQTEGIIEQPLPLAISTVEELEIVFGAQEEQLAIGVVNAQGDWDVFWSEPVAGTLSCLDCPNPFITPSFTTDYQVTVVDENGCEDEAIIRVLVLKPKLVVVPSGFSPNSDQTNDLLLVHGRPGTTVESFQVYDRWGELVYEEGLPFDINSPNVGWDGTFRDQPASNGVYVWVVQVTHEDGTQETFRGQTTLVR